MKTLSLLVAAASVLAAAALPTLVAAMLLFWR